MEKTKLALLLLICSALMVNASTMAYNVGVKSGDWMKYDVSITLAGQSAYKGTVKVTIQTVNSTFITGTMEYDIPNFPYSLPTGSFSIYTSTWSISGSTASTFLPIPAGLQAGDTIPGYGTVQSIGDWNGRKAIVANGSMVGVSGQIYFDQQTGVFLEASTSLTLGTSFNYKLVETSLFSLPIKFLGLDWYIWVIIVVVIVVVIVGLFVILRKRRIAAAPPAPASEPSPPPPPPSE